MPPFCDPLMLCSHKHHNMLGVNMFKQNAFPINIVEIALFSFGVGFKHVSRLVQSIIYAVL